MGKNARIASLRLLPAAGIAMMLTACGGNGESHGNAAGRYYGTFTQGTTSSSVTGMVSLRDQVILQSSIGQIYAGTLTEKGTALSSTLNVYDISAGNAYSAIGVLHTTASFTGNMDQIAKTFIEGDAVSAGETTKVYLTYDASASAVTALLSSLAGNYTGSDTNTSESLSLQITSSGALTGTDTAGCTYAGQVSVPKSTVNAYDVSNASINCPNGGTSITGWGLISMDTSSQISLGVISSDASRVALAVLSK